MAKKKADTEDDFIPEKPEKAALKRKWWDFFFDERIHKIIGLLLVLSSVYLLVAFTSFLFTWKIDQSVVNHAGWRSFIAANPDAADNWMGVTGAVISHIFIHRWFGISSFAFVIIFFSIGFRILFRKWIIPPVSSIKYSFFGIIWLSLTLGCICSYTQDFYFLGGAFGYHGFKYLEGLIGIFGAPVFLIFYALIFSVAVWNIEFYHPRPVPELNTTETVDNSSATIPVQNDYYTHKDEIEDPGLYDETTIPEEPEVTEDDIKLIIRDEPEIVEDEIVETRVDNPLVPERAGEPDFEIEASHPENATALVKNTPSPVDYQGVYDPSLDYPGYKFPQPDLLREMDDSKPKVSIEELEDNKKLIVETLRNYNIGIEKIKATIGPTVTLYEIVPSAGVRISRIKSLEDDIALSLAALGIRIIAPIPGKGTIGIEVPNQKPEAVSMRAVLMSQKFQQADADLPVCFGKTISNDIYVGDLAKMPHLLMAGATGQGKSVGINVILTSLLYRKHPSQLKLVLVDPKKVELSLYKSIERHFLAKLPGDQDAIITDTKLVVNTLNSLCILMDTRYDLLKDAGVRNIKEYNNKFTARKLNPEKGHHYLPYIVVVIDELADLMMTAGKEVEYPIGRMAQLARAIGIHLILATQRPSVNVITGTIKANFPARVAFKVSSKIDSRTILDGNGADQLIGRGDMLISNGSELVRVQCAFVDTPEVEAIANFIGEQNGREVYLLPEVKDESETRLEMEDDGQRDAMFEEAARIIVQHQQGSTSLLQRRLKLGYNRAGRLIDQLEKAGIVGPFTGSKARDVLIPDEYHLEQHLKNI